MAWILYENIVTTEEIYLFLEVRNCCRLSIRVNLIVK